MESSETLVIFYYSEVILPYVIQHEVKVLFVCNEGHEILQIKKSENCDCT